MADENNTNTNEIGDSILKTIREMVAPAEDYTYFDADLIIHLNSCMRILHELGLKDFKITGETETWADYLGNRTDLEHVKSYIYYKIKTLFDPPQSSFVLESFKKEADKLEWYINAVVDPSEVGANV